MSEGIRGPRLSFLTGITERQRDYWARIGLLVPSVFDARGSGYQRLYSADDVLVALAIGALLKDGFTLGYIHWQLSGGLRGAIQAGDHEYCWGVGPLWHTLDLAGLRKRLRRLVAA